MIDLQIETAFPLSKAAKHRLFLNKSADRKPVNFSTVWRWSLKGSRGVRLETVRIGSTLCTTAEAIERFIERLTNPEIPAGIATPSQANREHRLAEAELEAAGV